MAADDSTLLLRRVTGDAAEKDGPAAGDDSTLLLRRVTGDTAEKDGPAAGDDWTIVLPQVTTRAIEESRAAADDSTAVLVPLTWGAASDQVVVGNIPRLPPSFQARPALLAKLARTARGVSVVHATTWAHGVGKTQVAATHARAKLADGWRLVAWVDAENAGTLLTGLAAIAEAAGLRDGDSWRDTADAGRAVRERLEADGDRCLIVFDNASDPDVLRPFVPAAGAAQVLITTNQQSMADLGTSVRVDVFTVEEALAFLTGRIGREDDSFARVLAADLRYLPMAIAQAAATIAVGHLTCERYLARLRELTAREHRIPVQRMAYPFGVAETVWLSLDAVRAGKDGDVCAGVLELMAVLSTAGVRCDLLHAAGKAGVLVRGRRRSQVNADLVDRALARLAEWSLLSFTLDGQVVVAHRLVMQMVRERLIRRRRLAAACRAAAYVLDTRAGERDDAPDHPVARDILMQITALAENATRPAAKADDLLARAMLSLRLWRLYHLDELGDSTLQAVAIGEPLAADFERMLGADHPDTLSSRNNLAAAYQAAGRVTDAIPLFEQTLASRERLLGPDHPDTLGSRNNLAAAYLETGRPNEAISLFEQVLASRERSLGADHRSTANSHGNLAAAYLEAGRPDEAIPLFEQTLAVRERQLGRDHADTLGSRDDLAAAYLEAGWLDGAIPLFEQTLAVRERQPGPRHPDTLGSRNNLAAAYLKAGRPDEAASLFEQTLAVRERQLGRDHADTLGSRDDLAAAYLEAGRPDEAIPLFEQTLAVRERVLGADHADTVATRSNLALAGQETEAAE